MDHDQHLFEKHHRKCPARKCGPCKCSEIYTPPTIPRYQAQLKKQAEDHYKLTLCKLRTNRRKKS